MQNMVAASLAGAPIRTASASRCAARKTPRESCISQKRPLKTRRIWCRQFKKRLGIDDDHVIRHFDVNGKLCPYPYIEASKWKVLHAKLTGQHQKIKAKRELDREKVFPADIKADWTSHKGKSYEIVKTNKKKSRGQLADGGWITITEKYAEKL